MTETQRGRLGATGEELALPVAAKDGATERRKPLIRSPRPLPRSVVLAIQAVIVAIFLLGWEYANRIPVWGGEVAALDPFFISSPSRVFDELKVQFGDDGVMLGYLWTTVSSALLGVAIGLVTGAIAGLVLSNSLHAAQILRPFIIALNAVPRVALIPVVVIVTGPSFEASVVSAVLVVFFVAFFNAYEGGISVAPHLLQNARLLGASRRDVMRTIRLPYVVAWTFAALPVAIAFGLLTVVTAEILTGYAGMGRLLTISLSTSQSSLTFASVVVLSVVGLTILLLAESLKRRVLHWWIAEQGNSGMS